MRPHTRMFLLAALLLPSATALQAREALTAEDVTACHYQRLLSTQPLPQAELALFSRMLPKGGDLHHHYSGSLYAETYLEWLKAAGYCVYQADIPAKGAYQYRIETQPERLSSAERPLCLDAEAIQRNEAFRVGLLMTWSNRDYGNHIHLQKSPDRQFFDTFGYFGKAADLDYRTGLLLLKQRAMDENLGYLETMLTSSPRPNVTLQGLLESEGTEPPDTGFTLALAVLKGDKDTQQAIAAYVQQLQSAAEGLDDAQFRLRFQSYVSRNAAPEVVFAQLYTAFAAAAKSPLIVGVNMVGPENGVIAQRDYSLHMRMLGFMRQQFPQVPIALHAGELVLGLVPPESLRSHIREAVEVAGAQRIGHGVDIAEEHNAPELLQQLRTKNIAVEINLTSNAFILGVKDEAHPLRLYARYGVPFVISSDDMGVSRVSLSEEYLLYISRYQPSYAQLRETVYNSIRYAFLSATEKQDELARLDKRFTDFEAQIQRLALQAVTSEPKRCSLATP